MTRRSTLHVESFNVKHCIDASVSILVLGKRKTTCLSRDACALIARAIYETRRDDAWTFSNDPPAVYTLTNWIDDDDEGISQIVKRTRLTKDQYDDYCELAWYDGIDHDEYDEDDWLRHWE